MKLLIKLILTTLAVLGLAYILDGITVVNWQSALFVALVLGILNTFLRPILIFLTIPITIVTLGLFLLVINAGIVMLGDYLLGGFSVTNFWWALAFSVLLSIAQGILYRLFGVKESKSASQSRS